MKIKLKVIYEAGEKEITREAPVCLKDLSDEFQKEHPYRILIARVNGEDKELTEYIDCDAVVEMLDTRTHSAGLAYRHSLSLIYLKAVREVMGDVTVVIENSLNKGLYTEIRNGQQVTEKQVDAIRQYMRRLVDEDQPIIKEYFSRQEAIEIWKKYNSTEKTMLLEDEEDIGTTKFYRIGEYQNFFYGLMVPSTGYIEYFELFRYQRGILLRFPYRDRPDVIPKFKDDRKLYQAFDEAARWQRLLDIEYLPELNRKIRAGASRDLILLSEALHEKKVAEIADRITEEKRRIVLIAGPSSSGKTTFARRLCVQLRVNGLKPLYMGTDDYFVERSESPIGADGKPDYENLDCIDINLFNGDLNNLLEGATVDLPEFDFMSGTKKFGRRIRTLEPGQPIVIEGIHALNDALTPYIDESEKFRIYISPFTQLNVDVHNRVPTTDARMLRRIVRDYKYRNHTAAQTIAMWPKVRAGEDRNIFPYNGRADVLFNSALVYELAVLKKYADPLLRQVKPEQPEYSEAQRMLYFIKYFEVINEERFIPNNSIMREFIGGSIFVE